MKKPNRKRKPLARVTPNHCVDNYYLVEMCGVYVYTGTKKQCNNFKNKIHRAAEAWAGKGKK